MFARSTSRHRCSGRDGQGFTLIELLLAIFIFAIVISSVYGAYQATFRITRGSEYQTEIAQQGGLVLARITADLESLVLGKGGFMEGAEHDVSGARGDSLSFLADAHVVLRKADPPAGRAIIRYAALPDAGSGLLKLYRADTIPRPGVEFREEEARQHLLCAGLKEVRFTYHDLQGNTSADWRSDDNSTGGNTGGEQLPEFPVLVEVELRFAESSSSERSTVFRTAVALPREPAE
jgi:prepilin-type N-terminal cleavage/methylation domain-containing protein